MSGAKRGPNQRGPQVLFYAVPARIRLKELVCRLVGACGLHELPAQRRHCTYLDTFDRAILQTDGVLIYLESEQDKHLLWRGQGRLQASLPIESQPRMADDLPPSRVGRELAKRMGIRALLPLLQTRQSLRRFVKLDDEDKTLLRLDLIDESVDHKRPHRYLAVESMIGYPKALKDLRDGLARCGCRPLPRDPSHDLFTDADVATQPAPPWNDYQLLPGERADVAARLILGKLRQEMQRNLDGTLKDLDSEFLHDFRVSVRRTRSLLGQIKGVFPQRRLQRFSEAFAWLGSITGPTRDLDVYLLTLPDYQARLPSQQGEALGALRDYLVQHQKSEQRALAKLLGGARYKKLMDDWGVFLAEPPPLRSHLPNAALPVVEVAGRRIWKLFRRVIREGRAISAQSPPEDLHELRKSCKKLRYLLEFFKGLYPEADIKLLVAELKQLQDNLGYYQDLAVQQASFEGFRGGMEKEAMLTERVDAALVHLVELLAEREAEVRKEFDEHFRRFEAKPVRRLFASLFKPSKADSPEDAQQVE